MNVVITSTGDKTTSTFDQRFGRAEYFCLYNTTSKETKFVSNANIKATNGAGTKAAEKMVELDAQKVISGDFGPKAKELLDKLNVQMVIIPDEEQSIADIIEKIK